MRYLVRARLKPGREEALIEAIDSGELGRGSIAYPGYVRCMGEARLTGEGQVRWLEVCYCREAFGPGNELAEELPYWEEYFELERIQNAHDVQECRDSNGSEPRACNDCDCTERLEERLGTCGTSFRASLAAHDKE